MYEFEELGIYDKTFRRRRFSDNGDEAIIKLAARGY